MAIEEAALTAISTLAAVIIGGGISYFTNRQQLANQLAVVRQENKTDFMAEETARHFLNHQGYTDRSFETLQKHLGGFDEEELRKILVRAGAIREYRADGSEWWRLLSRMSEYIEKKTAKHSKQKKT